MPKIILTPKKMGITPNELENCIGMLKNYGFVVKVKSIPKLEELEGVLKKHTWCQTVDAGGMDHSVERVGILYGLVQQGFLDPSNRGENGQFLGKAWLFLKDQEDYEAVVQGLADRIEDPEPFTISISSGYGQ